MSNEKWRQNIEQALSSEFHIFLAMRLLSPKPKIENKPEK
jgi:hypothetical protein